MDPGKLVALVQQYPYLWDRTLDRYKCPVDKEVAWKEIAAQMFDDYDEMDELLQREKLQAIKSRWRNMRDHYHKGLSGSKSKKRKYQFSEAMQFLNKIEPKRRAPSSKQVTSAEESVDEESSSAAPHEYVWSYFEPGTQPADPSPSLNQPIYPESPSTRLRPILPRSQSLDKKMVCARIPHAETQHEQTQLTQAPARLTATPDVPARPAPEEDPERLYLLSILPAFKRLGEDQKWRFRQVINDFFIEANTPRQQRQPGHTRESQRLQAPSQSSHDWSVDSQVEVDGESPSTVWLKREDSS